MRILLTNHFPLHESASGRFLTSLADWLEAAGHQVRLAIVDRGRQPDALPNGARTVRRVVCDPAGPPAELRFALPEFLAAGPGQVTFQSLADEQIAAYRDALRAAIDAEIDAFDPHIIHGQHVWLQGHLALEAGVPYVLTAWGEELATCRIDPRYRRYAQEAAENAGRIFVADARLQADVFSTFGELDRHVVTVCPTSPVTAAWGETLIATYGQVLVARFGHDDRA